MNDLVFNGKVPAKVAEAMKDLHNLMLSEFGDYSAFPMFHWSICLRVANGESYKEKTIFSYLPECGLIMPDPDTGVPRECNDRLCSDGSIV